MEPRPARLCITPSHCAALAVALLVLPLQAGAVPIAISRQISSSADDAVEIRYSGLQVLGGQELALGADTLVGLRFRDLPVDLAQATVLSARIAFTAAADDGDVARLIIHGEASADAAPFTATPGGLSGRARTAAVAWTPPARTDGATFASLDLASIVKEITARPDWFGGAMAFLIEAEVGSHQALAFDGEPAFGAVLDIDYEPAIRLPEPGTVVLPGIGLAGWVIAAGPAFRGGGGRHRQ